MLHGAVTFVSPGTFAAHTQKDRLVDTSVAGSLVPSMLKHLLIVTA